MKIRRSRPTVEWTQVPNVVARDYRLSWRARGLLVELLSYPPGWEITIDELVKRAQRQAQMLGGKVEGRDAMRAAARELKAVGYLVATKYQDERGRWHTVVEVTDAPMWNLLGSTPPSPTTDDGFPVVGATSGEHHVSAGHTDDGFPGVGSPGVGIPGVSRKKERKKETPPPNAHREAEATGASGVPAQNEEEEDPSQNEEEADSSALELVDAAAATWEGHRSPTPAERATLAQRVAEALQQGATPEAIRYVLSHDLGPGQARSAVAVVMSRTAQPGWWAATVPPTVTQETTPMPPWCGECESPHYRWVYDSEGRPGRCPNCNPHADQPAAKPRQDAEATAAPSSVVSGLEEFRRKKALLRRA